jgi:hypothetical protein
MRKTVYPKIVDCLRMASSSVRNRRSARTVFTSVQVLGMPARCPRQPRSNVTDTHHPENLNGVLQVNRTWDEEEADVPGTYFKMRKTVYPKIVDCVRMASASVRKRRSARTDFSSVQLLPTPAY